MEGNVSSAAPRPGYDLHKSLLFTLTVMVETHLSQRWTGVTGQTLTNQSRKAGIPSWSRRVRSGLRESRVLGTPGRQPTRAWTATSTGDPLECALST